MEYIIKQKNETEHGLYVSAANETDSSKTLNLSNVSPEEYASFKVGDKIKITVIK